MQTWTALIYAAHCNWEPRRFARRSPAKIHCLTTRCRSWWTRNVAAVLHPKTTLVLRRRLFLRFFRGLFETPVGDCNIGLNLIPLVNRHAIRAYHSNQKRNFDPADLAILFVVGILRNRAERALVFSCIQQQQPGW